MRNWKNDFDWRLYSRNLYQTKQRSYKKSYWCARKLNNRHEHSNGCRSVSDLFFLLFFHAARSSISRGSIFNDWQVTYFGITMEFWIYIPSVMYMLTSSSHNSVGVEVVSIFGDNIRCYGYAISKERKRERRGVLKSQVRSLSWEDFEVCLFDYCLRGIFFSSLCLPYTHQR